MRFKKLKLIRYGHFTDFTLDLPADIADFHFIYGHNEAGKSTALAAVGDVLFGIPPRSPYNFLHTYSEMQIGVSLENRNSSLDVIRRKGRQNTVLSQKGVAHPRGDHAFQPFIGNADRMFFERMFSLDHLRLQSGGKEILKASDDVGQMIFSAGAGIAGLGERLTQLSNEAEKLWTPRRAKHRKFYIASDKLKEAKSQIRQHTVSAKNWQELRRTNEDAESFCEKLENEIEQLNVEQLRLSRIRRVLPQIREIQKVNNELINYQNVRILRKNASSIVEKAEQDELSAKRHRRFYEEKIESIESELESLQTNPIIIERAADIRHLYEQWIEIRGERIDLPKRQAELRIKEGALRERASELGWSIDHSIENLPSRTRISVVRQILNQRGEVDANFTNCRNALNESQETLIRLEKELNLLRSPLDVSTLNRTVRTVQRKGDLSAYHLNAESNLNFAQKQLERKLIQLNPGVQSAEQLLSIPIPAEEDIRNIKERKIDCNRRLHVIAQQCIDEEQELQRNEDALNRRVQEEQVVTREALADARKHRDRLWKLVRQTHSEDIPLSNHLEEVGVIEMEDLPDAFEQAVVESDQLADRRFDHAEAVGRVSEIKRVIGDQQTKLSQSKQNKIRILEERDRLVDEWQSIWDSAPFEPLSVDSMLEWLDGRKSVLEAMEIIEGLSIELEKWRKEDHQARDLLTSELIALGIDENLVTNQDLNTLIDMASGLLRKAEAAAEKKASTEVEVVKANQEYVHKKKTYKKAKAVKEEWLRNWTAGVAKLGLSESLTPESVSIQIEIIEEMRELVGQIFSLRNDRIAKIKRDISEFENSALDLVGEIALDLAYLSPDDAVVKLKTQLDEAERALNEHQRYNRDVSSYRQKIIEHDSELINVENKISYLKNEADVTTSKDLKLAINRSDQIRKLKKDQQQLVDILKRDGDGKSLDELEKECEDVDYDQIVASEGAVQNKLKELQSRLNDGVVRRTQSRREFKAIGGENAAAIAEADRQEALAEMQATVEQYIRVKTSALLLKWSIDRYRKEKQAPLLLRASEIFKLITDNSFSTLQIQYDDQDNPTLAGKRHDGELVSVSGMSTGTVDQLYLALRIASVEEYLEKADALPFIADDLFINFDDDRAVAGMKMLGELSQKTQVLFFSHHDHLAEIAKDTLGNAINVVNLSG